MGADHDLALTAGFELREGRLGREGQIDPVDGITHRVGCELVAVRCRTGFLAADHTGERGVRAHRETRPATSLGIPDVQLAFGVGRGHLDPPVPVQVTDRGRAEEERRVPLTPDGSGAERVLTVHRQRNRVGVGRPPGKLLSVCAERVHETVAVRDDELVGPVPVQVSERRGARAVSGEKSRPAGHQIRIVVNEELPLVDRGERRIVPGSHDETDAEGIALGQIG
ncbi:MAG: hypothetical protein C4344_01815 [Acidimicrobiia bacterium]